MSKFTSLFSNQTEEEKKLLIRSAPLILFTLLGCYVLLLQFFGFVIATVAIPFVGIAFGICNKHFARHER
jgi:hypothetical protein